MEKQPPANDILLYTTADGSVKIEVLFENETFWLSQKRIADLFGVERSVITKHLKNVFETGELDENSTCAKIAQVQKEGNREVLRETQFYNLDAVIAVGYRVNSHRATQFRIWATQTLKEFIIKGFVLDDGRLKQGNKFGRDYFDELLERIRDIRSSERRFYQKITDIYALAADYSKEATITQAFFATVQNKLHWAITGKTAAETIYAAADASQLHMGLTNWKQSPDGKILKSDVTVAKNYLSEAHITKLNRIVSAYLDLAESRAESGIVMNMEDWAKFLNQFLDLSNAPILQHKGTVTALEAKIKAETEYEKYKVIQDQLFESDFDKEIKKMLNIPKK
jgi:hypothetical protein